MRNATRLTTTALVIFLALYVGACKSSGPKMDAPPPQPTPAPTPDPAEVSEEVVHEPVTETIVSEEVTEELPEDIAQLNAQGYLADAFFDFLQANSILFQLLLVLGHRCRLMLPLRRCADRPERVLGDTRPTANTETFHTRQERQHSVVVFLGDRVKLMRMAARALDCQT